MSWSIERYVVDWDASYSSPDGRWCYADEAIEAIAAKDAEIARLTARCERLAACVRAYEEWDRRIAAGVYRDGHWPDHEHKQAFFDALNACRTHNDLGGAE